MSAKQALKHELPLLLICVLLGLIGLLAYAASKFVPGRTVIVITAIGLLGSIVAFAFLAFRLKRFWLIVGSAALSLFAVIAGTYILLFAFVTFFQDDVANRTSSFFQPRALSAEAAGALAAPDVKPLELVTPDGAHLRGWLVRNSAEARSPLVIYFGGSGSESSELIPYARRLDGWSVALVNYRGFGLSEGTPTHEKVLADALFIYDSLSARADIDPRRVVSMGYSLGTGAAVYLSEQRPVTGTILVSPYDRWSLIGLKQTPLYAPLAGILKPYFNSISRAASIRSPLLALAGSEDTLVPPELSRRLVDTWGGEAELNEYPGEDHSLLFHQNSSWADIQDFLRGLQQQ